MANISNSKILWIKKETNKNNNKDRKNICEKNYLLTVVISTGLAGILSLLLSFSLKISVGSTSKSYSVNAFEYN